MARQRKFHLFECISTLGIYAALEDKVPPRGGTPVEMAPEGSEMIGAEIRPVFGGSSATRVCSIEWLARLKEWRVWKNGWLGGACARVFVLLYGRAYK